MKVKVKKKRRWILNLSILLILFILIFQLIVIQINILDKKNELSSLQEELSSLQSQNDSLQSQIDNGLSDSYIENVAREKLNYVSPFERIFIDIIGK